MKLYFEAYPYRVDLLSKNLSSHFYTEVVPEVSGTISYVGYYFNVDSTDPSNSDSVFILPKVFLDEHNRPFGIEGLAPEDLIDLESSDILDQYGIKDFVFGLSTWLYRAINVFTQRNQGSEITETALIQNVVSNKGDASTTYLDVILQLLKFNHQHKNLFTYISIINNSGNNKINWNKTISKTTPIAYGNKPFYTSFYTKDKCINYDEELIVIYYSTLDYLRKKYSFKVSYDLNYPLIPSRKIASMMESGKGTRRLKQIRHKYFTDELVSLWHLLYTFYERSESVLQRRYHNEELLVRNFNIVFEDMIDYLIGEDTNSIPSELKYQVDGKRVDHIYSDTSLLPTFPENIYFIGDSKYYKTGNALQGESIYKQYTYARNVIQYNIDNLLDSIETDFFYRDPLTEGYNVTPNFFIRGVVDNDTRKYSYASPDIEQSQQQIKPNKHFNDRLFDRDTLIVQSYNINFLYVLSIYASHSNSEYKDAIKSMFRKDLINTLNEQYTFYKVYPNSEIETFVDKFFRRLIGKMFRTSKGDSYLWLAFEKDSRTEEEDLRAIREYSTYEKCFLKI